jgi:hypothetical protein
MVVSITTTNTTIDVSYAAISKLKLAPNLFIILHKIIGFYVTIYNVICLPNKHVTVNILGWW